MRIRKLPGPSIPARAARVSRVVNNSRLLSSSRPPSRDPSFSFLEERKADPESSPGDAIRCTRRHECAKRGPRPGVINFINFGHLDTFKAAKASDTSDRFRGRPTRRVTKSRNPICASEAGVRRCRAAGWFRIAPMIMNLSGSYSGRVGQGFLRTNYPASDQARQCPMTTHCGYSTRPRVGDPHQARHVGPHFAETVQIRPNFLLSTPIRLLCAHSNDPQPLSN